METLMNLTDDYQALMEYADSVDPDDEQVFLDTVEQLVAAIDFKADQYATVIDEIGGRIATVHKQIERLQKLEDALENNKKRMKEALITAMDKTGRTKIHTDLYTFSIQKNGGVLPLVIDGEVPDSFKKVVLENDNKKIRDALNNGEVLPFAHLGERGRLLSIR